MGLIKFVVLVVCILAVACGKKDPAVSITKFSESEAIARLEACPKISSLWYEGGRDIEKRYQILEWLKPLMSLSEVEAHAALLKFLYSAKSEDYLERTRVCIVFTRMYFDVPDGPEPDSGSTNSYYGYVAGGKQRTPLWPLEENSNGNLELTGVLAAMGSTPYLFENEFRSFSKKYGRRRWP